MNVRDRVAAYAAAVDSGAPGLRMSLSDDDALELAMSLEEGEAKNAELLATALEEITAITDEPEPEAPAARAKYGADLWAAIGRFWEAFEGQVVSGVEIVRRR